MGKRKKPEEIKRLLAEAERDLAKGLSVADVCRKLGVSEVTDYRWRQRFSPAQADDARKVEDFPLPRFLAGIKAGQFQQRGGELATALRLGVVVTNAPISKHGATRSANSPAKSFV